MFKIGDKVRVTNKAIEARSFQYHMRMYINQIGYIIYGPDSMGDYRVRFSDNREFYFFKDALELIQNRTFKKGDEVIVINNLGYSFSTEIVRNKTVGIVVSTDDETIRVNIAGGSWNFDPEELKKVFSVGTTVLVRKDSKDITAKVYSFCSPMERLLGEKGRIASTLNDFEGYRVEFKDGETWSYPSEALERATDELAVGQTITLKVKLKGICGCGNCERTFPDNKWKIEEIRGDNITLVNYSTNRITLTREQLNAAILKETITPLVGKKYVLDKCKSRGELSEATYWTLVLDDKSSIPYFFESDRGLCLWLSKEIFQDAFVKEWVPFEEGKQYYFKGHDYNPYTFRRKVDTGVFLFIDKDGDEAILPSDIEEQLIDITKPQYTTRYFAFDKGGIPDMLDRDLLDFSSECTQTVDTLEEAKEEYDSDDYDYYKVEITTTKVNV